MWSCDQRLVTLALFWKKLSWLQFYEDFRRKKDFLRGNLGSSLVIWDCYWVWPGNFTAEQQKRKKFTWKHLSRRLFPYWNFIKKETPSQVFSCEFCRIFKKNFWWLLQSIIQLWCWGNNWFIVIFMDYFSLTKFTSNIIFDGLHSWSEKTKTHTPLFYLSHILTFFRKSFFLLYTKKEVFH